MPSYRLEESPTARAGCQNKECKDAKIKIQKGELRVGSWIDNERIQSWVWRHWGCTTPRVIANIDEVVEEGSAKSEKDFTVIDGYEELSPENQEKVREALEQGHVADEDWKGDVECNRPGMTGFRKRLTKKEKEAAAAAEKEEATEKEKPAKKTQKRAQNGADTPASERPKRANRAKKAAEPESETESEPASEEEEEKPKKTTKRGRAAAKTAAAEKEQPKKAAAKPAVTSRKRKSAVEDDTDVVSEEKSSKRGRKAAAVQDDEGKPQRGRARRGAAARA